MSYIELTELLAMFPASQIIACLDDDNDGVADPAAWAEVQAQSGRVVDAALEDHYSLPLDTPVPAKVKTAAAAMAVAFAFKRRGVKEKDCPFAEDIAAARSTLKGLADGSIDLKLGVKAVQAVTPAAITSPIQTGTRGDVLA
jgi:phage gp36-like protein